MDTTPKTRGIAPATGGPLQVLQFTAFPPDAVDPADKMPSDEQCFAHDAIEAAAHDVASYHPPVADQVKRYARLTAALADFLTAIVELTPPGPERSTAISRAREAKFWAAAAVAMEKANGWGGPLEEPR